MRFVWNTLGFAFAACMVASAWAGSTATAANLLFQSGFEPSTTLGAIASGHQSITGTDNSTNFNWSSFPFEDATAVQLHIEGTPSDFFNKLDTSEAHSGTQSLLLDISGYPAGSCCEQVPLQSSANSNPAKTVYYRLWMMLPTSEQSFLSGNNSYYYHMTTEWKTLDDFREQLSLNTTNSHNALHPHMQMDDGGINCSNNSSNACNWIDPNTGATVHDQSSHRHWVDIDNNSIQIPFGQWFEVETYFHRSQGNDGEYDTAINGVTVGHATGPNYGNLLEEIRDMYWVNLYTAQGNGSEWIDDLEIWDGPPCGTFPCGTSNSQTSYAGPIPPFMTSRAGAIGEVGMNFSYQATFLGNPSSMYLNGSLPPGLSMSGQGLISGTPTSSGTWTLNIEATNSTGKGAGWLDIQILPSQSSAPTISSFSASNSTINAGQWTQLKWVQSGAQTLSINGTDVTGADPYPVQPNTTTTYTLTATNAAGKTTSSVTVNVNGSTQQKPSITSATSASGTVGSAFSYQIAATNSPTSYGASGLPGGLSVNTSTGLISGTPTTAGTYTITLRATNSYGTGNATLTINIASISGSPPAITSATRDSGTARSPFGYQITATNNPTSYGAYPLPAALSVNTSTGLISGIPLTAGAYIIMLSATNNYGTGLATLTLTISPANDQFH